MKKLRYLILGIALLTSVSVWSQEINQDVDAKTFKALMTKSNVIIDLRTPNEIKTKGKIAGAIEIDFLAIDAEEKIKKLDKNKTYMIYCAGGGRSSDCKDLMVKERFKNIIHLTKGFDDWKKQGFEVELVK